MITGFDFLNFIVVPQPEMKSAYEIVISLICYLWYSNQYHQKKFELMSHASQNISIINLPWSFE